tara:strand:+ start:96 stop:569 length:474 start_codon:yes stop_codon:yes gene_type:complete
MKRTLTEQIVLDIMKEEYQKRLQEALSETDVFDDDGNVLISQGLKVRHKDTQFEYTVDDVIEDPESGKTMIKLRLPEEPRFEPPPEEEGLIADVPPPEDETVLGEQDPAGSIGRPPRMDPTAPDDGMVGMGQEDVSDDNVEIFTIDQEEFEKEYEVK